MIKIPKLEAAFCLGLNDKIYLISSSFTSWFFFFFSVPKLGLVLFPTSAQQATGDMLGVWTCSFFLSPAPQIYSSVSVLSMHFTFSLEDRLLQRAVTVSLLHNYAVTQNP